MSDHDEHTEYSEDARDWSVKNCTIEDGLTNAFGEMFFSPSGNSSRVCFTNFMYIYIYAFYASF